MYFGHYDFFFFISQTPLKKFTPYEKFTLFYQEKNEVDTL